MPLPDYLRRLRAKIGHDTVLMAGVICVVINEAGQVLAQRRSDDGKWCLPGGILDPDEHPGPGATREVLEETGLLVEVERLVGVYSKPQKQEVVLTFRCRVTGGQLTSTAETRECRFFSPADIPINTLPKHRQRVEDALLNQPQAIIRDQRSSSEEDQRLPLP